MNFEEGSLVSYVYKGFKKPLIGHVIEVYDNDVYVRFDDYDRRIDKLIKKDELELLTPDKVSEKKSIKISNTYIDDEKAKIRKIDTIQLGKYVIDAWYFAPYPIDVYTRKLYVCEFCMKYFLTLQELRDHYFETKENRIPGREIYRKGNISIFEVKGRKQKLFCQCLSLLGKLFIEHKAAFYDVDQFNYYVLCECDDYGAHIAAFYSVEITMSENILSCIVVLPPYQKKGYGRLLISLSYEIARRSGICSGPERPLSDMGHAAYLSYWKDTIMEVILNYRENSGDVSVLSARTNIEEKDVEEAVIAMGIGFKFKKKGPVFIDYDKAMSLEQQYANVYMKPRIDPELLLWFRKGTFH